MTPSIQNNPILANESHDPLLTNHPSAFDFYHQHMNAQSLHVAHVSSNQTAPPIPISVSVSHVLAHGSALIYVIPICAAFLNVPLDLNYGAEGGTSIQDMTVPMISMTTASNMTQAAPIQVKATSVSAAKQACGSSQTIGLDHQSRGKSSQSSSLPQTAESTSLKEEGK